MKVNCNLTNSAESKPAGIKDFFENLVRVKKNAFQKEKENIQLKFSDIDNGHQNSSGDNFASLGENINQPLYRIKIRMRG